MLLSDMADPAVSRFVDILRHQPGPQMCYQVGFCFWLLSFDPDIAEEINKCVAIVHCIAEG